MFATIQRVIAAKAKDCIIAIETLDRFGKVLADQKLIIGADRGCNDNAFEAARV
jgi:hypothetical protein